MKIKAMRGIDPAVQLIFLALLAIFMAGIFVLMAQGIIGVLWGVNLFEHPEYLQHLNNPQVVNMNRLLLVFQNFGLFIVPALLFARLASPKPQRYMLLDRVPPRAFLWVALALMLLALVPVNYLGYLNSQLSFPDVLSGLEGVLRDMEDKAAVLTHSMLDVNTWGMWGVNVVVMALLPAIGEELLFRGALLHILMRWMRNKHVAVWVCGGIFSFIHFQFYGFLPRLLLGALLGYLVVWSGSLIPAMLAHFLNNGLAVTFAFAVQKGWIAQEVEEAGAGPGYLTWAAIGFVLLIAAMRWSSKRSHWKTSKEVYFSGE